MLELRISKGRSYQIQINREGVNWGERVSGVQSKRGSIRWGIILVASYLIYKIELRRDKYVIYPISFSGTNQISYLINLITSINPTNDRHRHYSYYELIFIRLVGPEWQIQSHKAMSEVLSSRLKYRNTHHGVMILGPVEFEYIGRCLEAFFFGMMSDILQLLKLLNQSNIIRSQDSIPPYFFYT